MKLFIARRLAVLTLAGMWGSLGLLFWWQSHVRAVRPANDAQVPELYMESRMTWSTTRPDDDPRVPSCMRVIRATAVISGRLDAEVQTESNPVVPEGKTNEVFVGDLRGDCLSPREQR